MEMFVVIEKATKINDSLLLSPELQVTEPTHVCQCRQVERTKMADRVDVGISGNTNTAFTDSVKQPTAVLVECSSLLLRRASRESRVM